MSAAKAMQRADALSGCNFLVYFNYVTKVGFSKISSIEQTIATEAFVEGGVNDAVHSLYSPLTTEKIMVFERGILLDSDHFTPTAMTVGVGQQLCENVIIAVLGTDRRAKKIYALDGCIFKKWSISDMDAMNDQVLIERFEMAYERMEEC
ncbi:phage tail protein [Ruminococcaceae bacterium OttesenSCG-928-L11]|nr:phage tail protein [Ruminococcaceae bacterium OttesenSCG-928-L11]